MTVDVDIAALACLYASRAASPEPCGPRGTAAKRSFPPRGRASPASSTPSPPSHTKKREIHASKGEVASRDEPTSRFAFQKMQAAGFHPTQISQAPFKLQSSASWRPVPRPPRARAEVPTLETMANYRSHHEGQSAAEQSCSVSVPRDDSVGTQSFGSQNGAYDDLCAFNDPNGHDARRRSGGLEDQQESPTSVAAQRAYGASGLGRSDAQRNALEASPSGGSDLGAPVRPPPQKRKKDGPSGRDADAEPSAGATLALASRGDDTRGDVPFANEPFAKHCKRAADLVKQYPDQPDVLSLGQVLASQVTRVGLPKALALKDAGVVAGWGRFREYEAEVASLRRVCERKLGERIMLSTLQVESLEHLADHVQVNIMFFDPTWGKNGDEKNVGQRCYTYVVRDVYQEAAAIGVISADDALRLSEGQFVADTMPFAMDVSFTCA